MRPSSVPAPSSPSMAGWMPPKRETKGRARITGSPRRLLRSTITSSVLHRLSQCWRSEPLPPLYWSMLLTHPASSSRWTSRPRGLSSRMETRASTVVSLATQRSIEGVSGSSGAGSPALIASRFLTSHSRASRLQSSFSSA